MRTTVAATVAAMALAACGQGGTSAQPAGELTPWTVSTTGLTRVLDKQTDAQERAADEADRKAAEAAREAASEEPTEQEQQNPAQRPGDQRRQTPDSAPGGEAEAQECTTDPADRPACRFPDGAEVTEGGGDVDGDGVFEEDEPVGPGYRDPRVYDGGKTTGEVMCEHAREQGLDC
ncbi:MAG TPA: hypothetical protein DEQ61_15730 [Streptomyces sp.]|nr:hypothetical protein [Streptomyces sp.]